MRQMWYGRVAKVSTTGAGAAEEQSACQDSRPASWMCNQKVNRGGRVSCLLLPLPLRWLSGESFITGKPGCLAAVFHVQLGQDTLHVVLHRVLADDEIVGYLLVRGAVD